MVKLAPIRKWMALSVVGCAVSASGAASTCKTLADKDNTFIKSLFEMLGDDSPNLPLSKIFAEFDDALPWLSTCAAAFDVSTITSSISTSSSLQSCIEDVQGVDFSGDDINARFTSSICPTYKDSIVSCAKSVVKDILLYNMDNTNGCCDDFEAKIKALFSDSIDVMVDKLMQFVGNVLCSQRTFSNLKGTGVTEMCGFSIVNSLSNFNEADMTDLLQIPNAGMCDAFEGKSFTNTKGGTSQFAFNTDEVDSMGICVRPLDALLTHLRTWPIFQQTLDGGSKGTFSLTDWFANDKSITGDKLIAWAVNTDNFPMIVVRTLDKVFDALSASGASSGSSALSLWGSDYSSGEEFFHALADEYSSQLAAFATHIPNSANCRFSSQEVSEPYTVVSTGSVSGAASVRAGVASALVAVAITLVASAMMVV